MISAIDTNLVTISLDLSMSLPMLIQYPRNTLSFKNLIKGNGRISNLHFQ